MKKKYLVLLATIICISLVFSACQREEGKTTRVPGLEYEIGDTGGLELPLTDKGEAIRILVTTDVSDISNKYAIEKLREITGLDIKLEVLSYGSANSSGREKLTAMIASKNMPDITGISITESMAMDLAAQGALAPVNDYLDELPNIRSIFADNDENSWVFKSFAAADGKLYGIPHYDQHSAVSHGILYRKDIFDKHNIPMWNSPDTFYNTLKKLKELYPDSSPYTSKTQKVIFTNWGTSWGTVSTKPYYDEGEKIWKFTDTDSKYREMLDYMRKLYDEKLLDSEFLTMTEAAWTSKMTKADQAFITYDWIGRLEQFSQLSSESTPDYDLRYGNPVGPKQTLITLPKVNRTWFSYVAAGGNSSLAWKLLDFIFSPAGTELLTLGIKGETYEIDKDNMAKFIGFPEDAVVSVKELEDKYGLHLEGLIMRNDKRGADFRFTEREQEAQDYAKKSNIMEPTDPVLAFTGEEKAEIIEINTGLIKACEEFSVKYILTNETGEAAWNAWVKQASALGSERLIEIYNAAQKRFDSN